MIERFSSGSRYEDVAGYSRAVRCGPFVLVAGTTATGPDGEIVGVGDAYLQTQTTLANVEAALRMADARLSDVVQTRLYVTDIETWPGVSRAHAETFGEIRPVTALVEVSRLVDPRMLVEIEAVAYVG